MVMLALALKTIALSQGIRVEFSINYDESTRKCLSTDFAVYTSFFQIIIRIP